MSAIPADRNALLSQDQLAAAFTELGVPTSPDTLQTKRSRGGGPPYGKYARYVRYTWGPAHDWLVAQYEPRFTSTSDRRNARAANEPKGTASTRRHAAA
jgi:hypothetical protein